MAINDLKYRQARPEDAGPISALLSSMYKIRRPPEFYIWQCFQNQQPVVLMCAYLNDELVGLFGIQKRELVGGIVCGQANWLNTSPAWQGKGIFKELANLAIAQFNDLDLLFVIANQNARLASERALGFRNIGTLGSLTLRSFHDIKRGRTSYRTITRGTVFNNIADERTGPVILRYSSDYRSWRYAYNPIYSYAMIELCGHEYAVIKIFTDPVTGEKVGDIVDIECSLMDSVKLKELIEGACWHLASAGVTKITMWAVPGGALRSVASNIGFTDCENGSYFCLKVVNDRYEHLYDFSRWHLRQADGTTY